jgi:SAM-dependent methyltransferase
MPFYWRLSASPAASPGIAQHLPVRVRTDEHFDYLRLVPTADEWAVLETAYRRNENIGFLNPESGQLATYGASVNAFFLSAVRAQSPRRIMEIGCGAGYSILHLREHGFDAIGVDPSEYSLRWSERLGFPLINEFFGPGVVDQRPDFVYCNDVYEHLPDVLGFSRMVWECLDDEGTFCIATTNSTRSIELGDISMLEHQHVNMFTDRSIRQLLQAAGFGRIEIGHGSHGNTFHVLAHKTTQRTTPAQDLSDVAPPICAGFYARAAARIEAFERYYRSDGPPACYVPLRCIPWLATVGDFGTCPVFDSNASWTGKYIDGYASPIRGMPDLSDVAGRRFFIGSVTFFEEIRRTLLARGWNETDIAGIEVLR